MTAKAVLALRRKPVAKEFRFLFLFDTYSIGSIGTRVLLSCPKRNLVHEARFDDPRPGLPAGVTVGFTWQWGTGFGV